MKRYDSMGFEDELGRWVRFVDVDDLAKLGAENAKLEAENARLRLDIEDASGKLTSLWEHGESFAQYLDGITSVIQDLRAALAPPQGKEQLP